MSDRLYELMKEWAQKPGRKVLTCGADVLDWIRELPPNSDDPLGRPVPFLPNIYDMMAIEIHLAEDAPPRSWRLVLHDHCEVHYPLDDDGREVFDKGTVRHDECTIIEEGSI
jgi:hypothetical protein